MNFRSFAATALVVLSFLIAGCAAEKPPVESGKKVTMGNLDYQPENITVKVGESVIWENTVSITHTVTFDDASMSGKSSGSMNKAAKHTVKFDAAGTFPYHCAIPGHAAQADGKWTGMVGTVTVTA